jgi:hypothetical protein
MPDMTEVQEKVNLGIAQCKSGEHAKGSDTLVDAAMEARRTDPKHPLVRQWRTHMLSALTSGWKKPAPSAKANIARAWNALDGVLQKARRWEDQMPSARSRTGCTAASAASWRCMRKTVPRTDIPESGIRNGRSPIFSAPDRKKLEKLASSCRETAGKH